MKRLLVPTIIIAATVAVLVTALQVGGIMAGPETWLANWIHPGGSVELTTSGLQYVCISLLAFAGAWLALASRRGQRVVWLVIAAVAELFALSWILSLYGRFFQPLPSVLAVILSCVGGLIYLAILRHRAGATIPFLGKLGAAQLEQIRSGEINFDGRASEFETSVLVCDLANKYELADSSEPAIVAQASEKFTRRATEFLLKAGAYLHAADGEGVVAVFGFPGAKEKHAEEAVRAAFDLAREFTNSISSSNGESEPSVGVHVGVSSGSIVAGPAGETIFLMGEAVELARRFCVANRFYGSRILIGPRTFELANESIVARPIDFLSGVNAQERHEVYEPLALSADAPADLLARRDSFWSGVVFYREKRWAEAYAAFQKARGPENEEDAPLNLYLRRLEPMALHLMESGEVEAR